MKENSLYDKKSLKEITGKSADWNEVAKDCVAFSNAQGGIIDYGIEDDAEEPMPNQRVPEELVVTLQNKINGRTSNVNAYGEILTHSEWWTIPKDCISQEEALLHLPLLASSLYE